MTLISILLLTVAIFGGSTFGKTQLDDLIDEIIYEAGQGLIKNGLDKISLPDIRLNKEVPILDHMRLQLNITEGIFWNTSTLTRFGDANEIDAPDGTQTFSVAVGLTEAKSQFKMDYRVGILHGSKSVYVECEDNSVFAKVSVFYSEKGDCKVTLDLAEIKSLGSFKFIFSPKTFTDKIEGKLLSFVMNRLAGHVKNEINKHLTPILQSLLVKINACSYLPF